MNMWYFYNQGNYKAIIILEIEINKKHHWFASHVTQGLWQQYWKPAAGQWGALPRAVHRGPPQSRVLGAPQKLNPLDRGQGRPTLPNSARAYSRFQQNSKVYCCYHYYFAIT